MDVGFAGHGRNSLSNNKRLRGSRTSYATIKNLYVGKGNSPKRNNSNPLIPKELAAGRKRAIAYARTRNIRIYTQIAIVSIAVLSISAWAISKYLL